MDQEEILHFEIRLRGCIQSNNGYQQNSDFIIHQIGKENRQCIIKMVDFIKKTIKNSKETTQAKYLALNLLKEAMDHEVEFLVNYVSIKILKRLTIMAQFEKKSNDPNRGMNIFGKNQASEYSCQFFKILLYCLQKWSSVYGGQQKRNYNLFKQSYQELKEKHKVVFIQEIDNMKLQQKDEKLKNKTDILLPQMKIHAMNIIQKFFQIGQLIKNSKDKSNQIEDKVCLEMIMDQQKEIVIDIEAKYDILVKFSQNNLSLRNSILNCLKQVIFKRFQYKIWDYDIMYYFNKIQLLILQLLLQVENIKKFQNGYNMFINKEILFSELIQYLPDEIINDFEISDDQQSDNSLSQQSEEQEAFLQELSQSINQSINNGNAHDKQVMDGRYNNLKKVEDFIQKDFNRKLEQPEQFSQDINQQEDQIDLVIEIQALKNKIQLLTQQNENLKENLQSQGPKNQFLEQIEQLKMENYNLNQEMQLQIEDIQTMNGFLTEARQREKDIYNKSFQEVQQLQSQIIDYKEKNAQFLELCKDQQNQLESLKQQLNNNQSELQHCQAIIEQLNNQIIEEENTNKILMNQLKVSEQNNNYLQLKSNKKIQELSDIDINRSPLNYQKTLINSISNFEDFNMDDLSKLQYRKSLNTQSPQNQVFKENSNLNQSQTSNIFANFSQFQSQINSPKNTQKPLNSQKQFLNIKSKINGLLEKKNKNNTSLLSQETQDIINHSKSFFENGIIQIDLNNKNANYSQNNSNIFNLNQQNDDSQSNFIDNLINHDKFNIQTYTNSNIFKKPPVQGNSFQSNNFQKQQVHDYLYDYDSKNISNSIIIEQTNNNQINHLNKYQQYQSQIKISQKKIESFD